MISTDEITRLIAPLLLRKLTPAERIKIATILESLAAQQRELAAADQQVGHKVRRAALDSAPRGPKGGRPKGSGGRFLRVEPRRNGIGATIHVGRALWQELGEPRRLDPQRVGASLRLVPCAASVGYSVTQPKNGMPRFTVGQDLLDTLGIAEGRMAADIRAGAIVAE
jgi:hypothetical protein